MAIMRCCKGQEDHAFCNAERRLKVGLTSSDFDNLGRVLSHALKKDQGRSEYASFGQVACRWRHVLGSRESISR